MLYGLKHIPDAALRLVIPHLEAAFPPRVLTDPVRPEDSPSLSFDAGRQSVLRALRDEIKARETRKDP